jgi:hypothetical protein
LHKGSKSLYPLHKSSVTFAAILSILEAIFESWTLHGKRGEAYSSLDGALFRVSQETLIYTNIYN